MKSDENMGGENYSYFEYLTTKVEVLMEELQLIQKILQQNNLKFKSEKVTDTDIENETFERLKKQY